MMKTKMLLCVVALIVALTSCKNRDKHVVPVDFPQDAVAKDFQFPEDQERVYDWLVSEDEAEISKHAWGIWAGLTKKSGQQYDGQDLYVYDTWQGVSELSDASEISNRSAGCGFARPTRTKLNRPKQFLHAGLLGVTDPSTDYEILETVSYSPSAACFATSNLVFNKKTLESLRVKGGIGKISSFPLTSIITKPTYFVTKASHGLVRLPAWTSTPDPAKVFGNRVWNNYVYVDLDNGQQAGKRLVPVQGDSPSPEQIAAATCNRSDFLNFVLDDVAANELNARQDRGKTADEQFHAGSTALLVAMHVTTKEIENWTWQTYFWVPNPKSPGLPSSQEIADLMPEEVQAPANHYALSHAYTMVYPFQPVSGGSSYGARPVIAYNPYLEAGFGPNVFSHENTWKPEFQYGVQTNCAACHALAAYGKDLGYTTDQYIDMRDTLFNDTVQLDFAWSINGNLNDK